MPKLRILLLLLLATRLFAAADPAYTAKPLRERTPAAAGGKQFEVLDPAQCGVTVPNVFNDPRMWGDRFRELTLGAVETGIAVADFDRDGMVDIFVVSKNGPCALYRQTAPFKFMDVAHAAGVACDNEYSSITGASVVDINQDGFPDIYVCRYDAPNLLFVNNRDGTFTECAKQYGLDIKDASVHASFADYDRDGYVDCYLVTNILDFSKAPQGRRNYLLHNDGNGHFTDVSAKAGIWGLTQGHTAIWVDINHDGWPDIYVANDFETPDRLYLNKGDGTFVDVVDERLPHVTYFSMGADAGDINNDGLMDFFITDMRDRNHQQFAAGMEEIGRGLWEMERVTELIPQYMWNAVYLNTGTDHFEEIAHLTGMDATGWTFSTRLGDLDNDGRLDAFLTCGMIRNFIDADLVDKQNVAPTLTARANVWKNSKPRAETTLAYRNLGDLKFEDVSKAWGLDHPGVSFGCVLADLDGDGDLDIIFANYDAPPTIIRNHTTTGHRAIVKLAGRAPNLDGIGAEVEIHTKSGVQVRQLFTERGIVSSELAQVHFGLGNDTRIEKLTVRWPRGEVQTLENLPADRLITVNEPAVPEGFKPPPASLATPARPDSMFAESAAACGLKHANTVRPFDEFTHQRLLPRRLNGQGPALAVGDVNGDGIDDVFVSGSAGQPGELFLGQKDGTFKSAPSQPWSNVTDADESSAAFIDLNNDGHLDLLITQGGVQQERGDAKLNDLLYLNDGHGNFTLAPEGTLPADGESTGAVAVADFDGDHRPDVFIGGRVVPGHYPATPKSFLYHNVNGRLVDVTDTMAPGLRNVGMVTAAVWADVDHDGKPDLLVATEWGPICYFHNNGHGFEDYTQRSGLAGVTGWWCSLIAADLDGDGRIDLVAGNVGLNTKYHATATEPTVLYAGDFDGNGREAMIEAQYQDGKLYPARGRSKLAYSFPWLPKKYPTYQAYANATVDDVFGAERLARVRKLTATELASGIFRQQRDGTFKFVALPRTAQIAPINAIVARDFDGDGKLDLYCVGNNFGPEPSTGRFDGSLGVLLKGDGHGGFTPVLPADSGLSVIGEAHAAAAINLPGSKHPALVVARTEGPVLLFTPRAGH
ncbi:MAG TPA: VCBS repeat-containing protein [Candidatus Didemnitutus sp.]|nr:VCBS repeat-containing protein [Candidatus Didemnitutus sp.]